MLDQLKKNKELILIFLLALVLRVIGVWHGYPLVFNVDEPALVRSSLGIGFNINPHHFDWPHFHYYLNYIIYFFYIKFRGLVLDFEVLKSTFLWRDPIVFYLLSRTFNAFLGALTVVPLYLTGSRLHSRKAGLFTALFFSVFPLHVRVSHFALIDVPTVFWLSWAIYFAAKVLTDNRTRNYLASGLFSGFAMSAKYNGLFAGTALLGTHLITLARNKSLIKTPSFYFKPAIALIFCGLAFLIGTPFALFDYQTFIRTDSSVGALWQFTNVGSVDFAHRVKNFFVTSPTKLFNDLGFIPVLVFALYVVYSLKDIVAKNKEKTAVFAFIVIPLLIIVFSVSGFEKTRSHYYLICYPFIALGMGVFLAQYIKRVLLLFCIPLALSLFQVYILSVKDTRNVAWEYLQRQPKTLVVYNDPDFLQVALKLKRVTEVKKVKGYDPTNFKRPAYWVVLEPKTKKLPPNLQSQLLIDSTYRNGPNIEIFYLK